MAGWNPEPSAIRIGRMLGMHQPHVAPPMPKLPPTRPAAGLLRPPGLRRADGGGIPDHPMSPVIGAINTSTPGRADMEPTHVPPGSYVMPADIVSHIGEGNTAAGQEILAKMFLPLQAQSAKQTALMGQGAPYGGTGAPFGATPQKLPMGPGVNIPKGIAPRIAGMPRYTLYAGPHGSEGQPTFSRGDAHGGVVPGEGGQPGTPINISGGEFVVPPGEVKRRGRGDINRGHEILDAWVRHLRADHIKTLKKLPGPAQ
jgi:hypothetical protein